MDEKNVRPVEILLVEDDPGDALLTVEAFKLAKVHNEMHLVKDGAAAMDFLHKNGEYEDAATPDLIILDLNLPKKDGREVLAEINEDPNLKHIPVVILTTSRAEEDIMKAYEHHAIFITKPVELDKFFEEVKKIEEFWLSLVKLPSEKQ